LRRVSINGFEALDNFVAKPALSKRGGKVACVSGHLNQNHNIGFHRAEEERKKRKEKKALGCLPVCLSFIMRHIPHL
jgi:hypothetical protein